MCFTMTSVVALQTMLLCLLRIHAWTLSQYLRILALPVQEESGEILLASRIHFNATSVIIIFSIYKYNYLWYQERLCLSDGFVKTNKKPRLKRNIVLDCKFITGYSILNQYTCLPWSQLYIHVRQGITGDKVSWFDGLPEYYGNVETRASFLCPQYSEQTLLEWIRVKEVESEIHMNLATQSVYWEI
jgi:hypothetical protein